MTDVHEARIEAAARAMWEAGDPREPAWPDLPRGVRQGYRREARAALAAADAVVTVEQIRDELAGHPIGSGYYQTTVSVDEAREMAEAVQALIKKED